MGPGSVRNFRTVEGVTMICKYCKKEIEADSVFCRFCGERVPRKRKPKEEVRVPRPELTPAGKYRGRLMVAGQRVYVTEDTEAAYYIRARAVKTGMIREAANAPKDTLRQLIERFINDNEAVLSPSTVPAYRSYARNGFGAYMGMSAARIPWQRAVSDEAGRVSAKTLQNEWRLVTAALRYAGVPVPSVNMPRTVKRERAFLDFEQVQTFVTAIRGDACELAYLLALHSLRLSELLALNIDSIRGGVIYVRGAKVRGEHGYTVKELNKTDLSRRDVPVMIPRLLELRLPVLQHDVTLNRHLGKVCTEAGLPVVTMHGLRHSFASLAYHLKWTEKTTMQIGGWSTPDVVHEIYTHLSQRDVNEDVERMRAFYQEAVGKSMGKFDG